MGHQTTKRALVSRHAREHTPLAPGVVLGGGGQSHLHPRTHPAAVTIAPCQLWPDRCIRMTCPGAASTRLNVCFAAALTRRPYGGGPSRWPGPADSCALAAGTAHGDDARRGRACPRGRPRFRTGSGRPCGRARFAWSGRRCWPSRHCRRCLHAISLRWLGGGGLRWLFFWSGHTGAPCVSGRRTRLTSRMLNRVT